MNTILQLTPHDPLIARDGRPFGALQGNRMRGLPWLLPSVVAGSFRTALVKAREGDFLPDITAKLLQIAVAGVFPVQDQELYLPAPTDCVWDEKANQVHRVQPIELATGEGMDLPEADLRPVCLTHEQAAEDFKAQPLPAWWPLKKYTEWLTSPGIKYEPKWFTGDFLKAATETVREHVQLDADMGVAQDAQIYSSANLNVSHLPKFHASSDASFKDRWATVTLSARIDYGSSGLHTHTFNILHPLGGERRLVHWQAPINNQLWECPDPVRSALKNTTKVRMVLTTPAIFQAGWKPDLTREPFAGLKLVGVSNGRWKAASGWSLAATANQPRGPKPIRRMVPAGSVYFFECKAGAAAKLAARWLQSVSDNEQEQRDGFGLALWGTW